MARRTAGSHRSHGSSSRISRTLALAFSVAVIAASLAGPGLAGPRQKVEAARDQLESITTQFERSQAQVRIAQRELNQAATRLARAEYAYEKTVAEIEALRAEIANVTAHLRRISAQLEERAVQGFISGSSSELGFLLEASSFSDLSDRVQFLDAIGSDAAELAASVEHERAELEMRKDELQKVRERQAEELARLDRERRRMTKAFAAAQAARDRLSAARQQAEDLLAKRTRQWRRWKAEQAQDPVVSGAMGSNPFQACPVPGGGISNSFGAPRTGHLHAGVDIFAPEGSEIRAPFSGTASNATNPTGGLSVSVSSSSGAGYVYNAHLSSIANLGSVGAGDVIGYVGTSGNAVGTSPHNHFEWHPSSIPSGVATSPYGYSVLGDAVNPFPYLVAAC